MSWSFLESPACPRVHCCRRRRRLRGSSSSPSSLIERDDGELEHLVGLSEKNLLILLGERTSEPRGGYSATPPGRVTPQPKSTAQASSAQPDFARLERTGTDPDSTFPRSPTRLDRHPSPPPNHPPEPGWDAQKLAPARQSATPWYATPSQDLANDC